MPSDEAQRGCYLTRPSNELAGSCVPHLWTPLGSEISVSSIHLFLPIPHPRPSPLLRLVLSLIESSSRAPRTPPPGSLLAPGTIRPAVKEQGMEAGSPGCRRMRDVRPGPERAQPRGFQSQILLPVVICVSITPGQGSQTEGQSAGGPRVQLLLSLGEYHSISVSVTF